MKSLKIVLILQHNGTAIICLINLLHYLVVTASKDEDRLLTDLFSEYKKAARPAIYDDDTVNVTFGMTLSQIIDVVC